MFRKIIKGFFLLIGVVVSVLAFYILLNFIIALFMPEGWLFYESHSVWAYIIAVVCLVDLIHVALSQNHRKSVGRKSSIISAVLLVISSYVLMTNLTIVSDTHIIVKSPMNPIGTVHNYQDVENVEAYFTEDSFMNRILQKPGGTFIYEVSLAGKEYEFQSPTINTKGEYAETDSYAELEDLDKKLIALDIPKESNNANSELNELDILYNGIFHRIISNK